MYKITDTATGEEITVKYMAGSPRQYRFNGQNGEFNLNGDTQVLDENGKKAQKLTITPIAFRFFEENLFARGRKDNWAELFFIDDKNALSAIMFNNTSVSKLENLAQELFYEDLSLTQIKLTIEPEKKQGEKNGEKTQYYITKLTWSILDPAQFAENQKFVESVPVWRRDTYTETAVVHLFSGYHFPETKALPETVAE